MMTHLQESILIKGRKGQADLSGKGKKSLNMRKWKMREKN